MGFSIGQFGPDAWTDRNSRAYRIHMEPDLTVVAACEDVGCDQYLLGWETVCDLTDLTPVTGGVAVAKMIRSGASGRDYREFAPGPGGTVTVFRFAPHQRCFREHRTRPGFLRVYSGGRVAREHVSLSNLAEDYTEHVGHAAEQIEKG